jgi:hypothetical protein
VPELIPFRWPAAWHDAAKIELLQGTPYNCVLGGESLSPGMSEALGAKGITVTALKQAPATVIDDGRWPQVQTGAHGQVDTGPTGNPWINANGFAILAARAVAPDRPVWLVEDPPANEATRPDGFRLAVADAAAYGGCWAPPLDCPALPHIAAAQHFFMAHRRWREYSPVARLAVISEFAAPRRDFALEALNLITRVGVPFAVFKKGAPFNAKQFAIVLDIDQRDANSDPYELATEMRDKLGRRNDVVRLWNGSSIIAYYASGPESGRDLLQLVNYAARQPGEAVTAAVMSSYKSARIYTLETPEGAEIRLRPVRSGVEIDLPPFAVYAAIELNR